VTGQHTPPRRTQSSDNLQAVSLQDAAEARARAALQLVEAETARAEEAERRAAELSAELERSKAAHTVETQDHTKASQDHAITLTAEALTVQRKGRKYVIPFALVSILGPLLWASIADYVEMKRQARDMKDTFASTTQRIDKLEQKLSEQAKENAGLRETVAQLSGYLAGVLPKAGLMVPGAMPGAASINVVSDPLPIGAKRITPVNVRTAVPAPAPRP